MNNLSYTLFGIIAVLVGFCTWASIRLRAARIKAIRDHADIRGLIFMKGQNELEIQRLTENAGTMADMTAEYKVKAESLQTEVDIAHNSVSDLIKKVVTLEHSQFKLVETIRHTGIRNSKGVVKKSTEAQINEMLGIVVLAVELTPSKPARDWSVPQAFPGDYGIPKGTKVIKVTESDTWVKRGSIGIYKSTMTVKWESKDYDINGRGLDWCQSVFDLAPVNPTDHPEHPQFKK